MPEPTLPTHEQFTQAVQERATEFKDTMLVQLNFRTAIALIGQVQLALRHPANVGQLADDVRKFTVEWIDTIAGDNDIIRQGLMAGFEPAFDEMVKPDPNPCTRPPRGWYCTRPAGHDGPCAAWPVEPLGK